MTLTHLFAAVKYGTASELPNHLALRDARIDLNTPDTAGCSLLHYAVLRGLSRFVLDLIAAGADVNAADKDGCTPLHHAARLGNRYLVVDLIDAKADVKAADLRGWTAAHHAALGFMRHDYEDFHAIVRHLARAGANLFAPDNNGVPPRGRLAFETQHLPYASLIRDRFPMS
ncbi:ankyrin repeat domain-containing protein [Burkholderia vietnamiensis]|uniref:ankyrin repeat domain-containing protein n=1 Tax=Burkholderia vietnamiensis TaxID=60552 RepID=UPI00158904A6|nr:ankyrin repeat domain-containing protein [Burkholderia vietnamiensis]